MNKPENDIVEIDETPSGDDLFLTDEDENELDEAWENEIDDMTDDELRAEMGLDDDEIKQLRASQA